MIGWQKEDLDTLRSFTPYPQKMANQPLERTLSLTNFSFRNHIYASLNSFRWALTPLHTKAHLVLTVLVLILTGCTAITYNSTKQPEPIPSARKDLPLPRKGVEQMSFNIPDGWSIYATGPREGFENDYGLAPTSNPDSASISLSRYQLLEHISDSKQARDYLEDYQAHTDPNIKLRKIGSISRKLGKIGIYQYYSAYIHYEITCFYIIRRDCHVIVLVTDTEAMYKHYLPDFKKLVLSLKLR